MSYLQSWRSPRRWLPPLIATALINAWLIWALFHGNVFPFADPRALIRVAIYPNAAPKSAPPKPSAPATPAPATPATDRAK